MPIWFDCDARAGKLAIYTGDNDAPLYNPGANLARLKLHSDFEYPKIIRVFSGTLSLPFVASNTRRNVTTTLAAHGVPGGIPWVFGTITLRGINISLSGTVPIQNDSVGGSPEGYAGMPRTVALGADATNVLLHENVLGYYGTVNGLPGISFSYRVMVTDTLL